MNEIVSKLIGLSFVIIISYIIYRSASLLGYLLGLAAAKTNTELDDLLIPYIPLLIEVGVVVFVVLKTSEVFLGASAGALIGLLGGAGVALGLLFKDIIYDWCCTVIIYILEILEKEGIDRLHVDLVTSLQSDREIMKSVSNSNSVLKKN